MSLKYVDEPRMSDKIRINKPTNDKPFDKPFDKLPLRKEYNFVITITNWFVFT